MKESLAAKFKAHTKELFVLFALIFLFEIGLFHWQYWASLFGVFGETLANPPFIISKTRIAAIVIIYGLFLLFRPSSKIWRIDISELTTAHKAFLATGFVTLCIGVGIFSQISGQAAWLKQGGVYNPGIEAVQDGNQYNHLADALIKGQFNLNLPVSDLLMEMDNPYDPALRAELNAQRHEPIYWDYAYYQGNYYCYFGVVPCLITFLPFKLITGMDLRTDCVVVLFAILVMLAGGFLLYQFKKNFIKRLSLGGYLTGFMLVVLSSGLIEQVFLPRIYPIPMLSALFFTYLGLSLWLYARYHFINSSNQKWNYPALLGGSFSIALTIGCRPQYVLAALLAFPIFFEQIRQKEFFSKRGLKNTIAVIFPFIIVAAPIAYYNFARFGSWTEFGAKYNLTGGDMTSYTFEPSKIAVQILEYLFLPFQFIPSFPFISTINESALSISHPKLLTAEPFYAGFMFLTPATFCIFCLIAKKIRYKLSQKHLLGLCLTCLSIALFNIVVASYVSGTNMRYFIDFGWLILIPTTLIIWTVTENRKNMLLASLLSALAITGLFMYAWTFLGTMRFGALHVECPTLFNALHNAINSLSAL